MRLLPLLLILILTSCSDNAPDTEQAAEATAGLHAWLDEQFQQQLDFSPLTKSRLGDKSAHGELDDVSEAAAAEQLQWFRDSVATMRAEFDRDSLNSQGRLSFDLWEYRLELEELNEPYRRHRFIFGRNGPQASLPNDLINYQRVDTEQDMIDYIARLQQSGRYMRQYLTRAQQAAADGIRAPYFDYDRAISEIERVTSGLPFNLEGESDLLADINTKLNLLVEAGQINAIRAGELRQQAVDAMLDTMLPAYQEVSAWLEADRVNVPDQAEGAWSLPNGADFYQARLQTMTTLPLTAQQIHDTGLREVARIQAEMEDIKREVGFEGSLQDFFAFMRGDDQFFFPNTDQGREDYLSLADEILGVMEQRLPDYFGILPKASLQVRRVESFREIAGGAAHYARGTADGSRPGTFYVHLADMRAVAINRLENLAYHEGLPGHHMQISIQQELTDIPQFRANTGYTAFSEGWGLYAEYLGKEMGGYNDPYAEFGRLSGEIWRAVRLVVDTGIHALRWTKAEAVDYALQNSPRPELSVRSEIRRYFNNPGQATAYKIGMMTIQEVRAEAEAALGDRFDIREFHDTVLGAGQLPMSVLEDRIEQWVASKRD